MKSNYFFAQEHIANESWDNAIGDVNWNDMTGADAYGFAADGAQDENAIAAAQGLVSKAYDQSRPLIINLDNTTGAAVSNVSFLQPVVALGSNAAGNYAVNAGIVPTCGNVGQTYDIVLRTLQSVQYYINTVYQECATTSQLTKSFSVTYNKLDGSSVTQPYYPKLDPNQNITTVITVKVSFLLNYYTKITLASLVANDDVTFSMYYSVENDPTRGMVFGNSVKQFGDPMFRKPLTIQGGAIGA
jgi:hypothetical protein